MDVHAFGQLLMYPFAYSCESIVKDAENLFEATLGAAVRFIFIQSCYVRTLTLCVVLQKAAKSVAGKVYEVGRQGIIV